MTTAETGMAQELLNAVGEDDRPDSDDGGFDNNIGGDFYDGGGGFNDNFIADIIGSGVGDANDAADDHGNLFQSFDDLYQLRIVSCIVCLNKRLP
jgi:hypothetical protein